VGLFDLFRRRTDAAHKPAVKKPRTAGRAGVSCAFETLEERRVLSADPLLIGAVYTEGDSGTDERGDHFEISFEGGAAGTRLTQVVINGDKSGSIDPADLSNLDVFFDTVNSGPTADNNGMGADEAATALIDGSAEGLFHLGLGGPAVLVRRDPQIAVGHQQHIAFTGFARLGNLGHLVFGHD